MFDADQNRWVLVDMEHVSKEKDPLRVGSHQWIAPETLTAIQQNETVIASRKAECFSLGLVFYFVATGNLLFNSKEDAIRQLMDVGPTASPIVRIDRVEAVKIPEVKSALKQLLVRDPLLR